MKDFPDFLQADISLHLNRNLLRSSPAFQGVNQGCLRALSIRLQVRLINDMKIQKVNKEIIIVRKEKKTNKKLNGYFRSCSLFIYFWSSGWKYDYQNYQNYQNYQIYQNYQHYQNY